MAASWFGLRGTLLTAGAVSSVFMIHILLDWGDTLEGLEMGALLHDVGKIGVRIKPLCHTEMPWVPLRAGVGPTSIPTS